MKNRKYPKLFVFIFLCICWIQNTLAQSTIIVPDDFPIIQEAIDAAATSDTIFIKKGVYSEGIIVNKSLAFIGESRDESIISFNDPALAIDVGNNTISAFSNLTIERVGTLGNAFKTSLGVNLLITNCKILGGNTALNCFNSQNGTVVMHRNIISNQSNSAVNFTNTSNNISLSSNIFDSDNGNRLFTATLAGSGNYEIYNNAFLNGPQIFFISSSELPAQFDFHHNIIIPEQEGNLGFDVSTLDPTNLIANAALDIENDYFPLKESPAINNGEGVDPDGSVADIGLHYFPITDNDGDGYFTWDSNPSLCDCDDTNSAVNPGAEEDPNNTIDDNCDGITPLDNDGDGYGSEIDCDDMDPDVFPGSSCDDNDPCTENDALSMECECIGTFLDEDLDGICDLDDCDPADPEVYPGNTETPYNGKDDDCDPSTLDDDLDQDGFDIDEDCDDTNPEVNLDATEIPFNGIDDDCDETTLDNDQDQDGYGDDVDCDDLDPEINPGVIEIPYNGVDEDCNESTPDDDVDGDGFGIDEDCNDMNAEVNPEAEEIPYNGLDDDCNPETLEDDLDMDGFNLILDCDDANPDINPATTEIPYNGINDDCDEETPDDDLDGDGYFLEDDCDDLNEAINPGMMEIPYNGIDDDCNAETADDDLDMDGYDVDQDCDDTDATINPDAEEIPNNDVDEDCDGEVLIIDEDMDGFNSDEDCDDLDAGINPGAEEIPNNEVDEDCDGLALIIDDDGDGFNSDEDCDDSDATINPNAEEICDEVDNNCDGQIDDGLEVQTYYVDADMDGYGDPDYSVELCSQPPGTSTESGDCDDTNPEVNPDAEEIANNGIDEDCDGEDLISSVNNEEHSLLDVYPNPSNGLITIELANNIISQIKLIDLAANVLQKNDTNNRQVKLDISNFPSGLYMLQVESQDGKFYFVKIHKI